jgi:hypothetical protein
MEIAQVLNTMLGAGLFTAGWFLKELWGAVKVLNLELTKLKADVSEFYVRKDDFKEFRNELLSFLQRIEYKLDSKQDKDK